MAMRYGDANLNGQCSNYDDGFNPPPDYNPKRRSTRHCIQGAAPGSLHHTVTFREFTRESLINIKKRKASRSKRTSEAYLDPAKTKLEPDPYLASGQQLPPALVRQLPPELVGKPIEDIDPYYSDQKTFVIISRGKELTRFSATKALYLLGPFHPIRRVVLYILVSSIFNLLVIMTILTNCILMTIQGSEIVERTEIIFTIIYTTELGLKVLARGFILDQFTYLRDPWNWLDFMVIIMAYLTIVVQDLGNLSVMRTFRVLRALKTVAIIPGMKTIVGAVIDSVKNLKDVVVLTLFSLSVFSLLGLQIYMGLLTQKCILNGPLNMTDLQWHNWCSNSSHWIPDVDNEIYGAYRLCGNATGAQSCPPDHTCLQGFGPNPDYGYTNFDTFGWALICSFRLMTQDFWEGLYMQVLKTAGSWHIIFFIVSIFLGSIYLMNLILAIVAMSYNELQRQAEEEEEAAAEDEAAFLESCRMMEYQQEQMSQLSRSTPDVGTSYRPSVEIGLVGQSMLASLCQNGLLGQRVRERLEQQMMLPEYNSMSNTLDGGGGMPLVCHPFGLGELGPAAQDAESMRGRLGPSMAPANRSHSLSVNLDCRRNSRHSSQQWGPAGGGGPARLGAGGYGPMARTYGAPLGRSTYDPLMMAISMTELRRKSSVRTNESYSPGASKRGSMLRLGQRRLLPNIGVSGKRLDKQQSSLRRRHVAGAKLAPRYVSSGVLMTMPAGDGGADQQQQQRQHHHGTGAAAAAPAASSSRPSFQHARSSMTSDRDLEILRQKAAMIRIVSDDCSETTRPQNKLLRKRVDQQDRFSSLENTATERCSSVQSLGSGNHLPMHNNKRSSSIQINPTGGGWPPAAPGTQASTANTGKYPRPGSQAAGQETASSTDPTTTTSGDSSTDTATGKRQGPEGLLGSEAAICEQPSHLHPSGRLLTLNQNRAQSHQDQSQQQEYHWLEAQHLRYMQKLASPMKQRRRPGRIGDSRRCSALDSSVNGAAVSESIMRRKSTNSQQLLLSDTINPLYLPGQSTPVSSSPTKTTGAGQEARTASSLTRHPLALLKQTHSSSTKTLHKTRHHHHKQAQQARSNEASPRRELSPSDSPKAATTRIAATERDHQQRMLAVDNYLKPSDRMHHLSVENFQQFGAIRPTAGSMMQQRRQQHEQLQQQRKHSLALDGPQVARGAGAASLRGGRQQQQEQQQPLLMQAAGDESASYELGAAAGLGASDYCRRQSLRQRGRLGSRTYINPATMVRSSFSRYRQSLVPTSTASAGFGQQQQQPFAGEGGGGGAGAGSVRRMSRDLVRHASDWSRMSMSTNVDLRRLLRLWSHTNPYQGARPSLGSCSIYSQTNQSARFNLNNNNNNNNNSNNGNGYDQSYYYSDGAPAGGAASACNSPRPSSVGSQAWQAYEVLAALSRRENCYQSEARAYGGALPLDDNLTVDNMSISARDKCLAYCLSWLDILCIWECCDPWLKVQRIIALVVFDPFTELFIILCILINTLFMALDSDDADDQMRQIFERGNYFFTATFAVEASMKIIALSPKFYFREGWNVFDSFIVGLSLLELGLEGVYGLSVLRSFRLLRVFKLAKSWPTLNLLISIMGKAVGDLGNLTFVLGIIVFIFAVMGMQLFGTKYVAENFPDGELPRWNFTDFMHSFMIVFRILCAEWIEPMWDCLLVGGWPCIPFFLIAVTVGNLVVLNLFLALLLASFGASNLSSPQADNVDTKKLQEAIERFKRFSRFIRHQLARAARMISSCLLFRRRRKRHGNRHGGATAGDGGGSPSGSGASNSGQGGSRTIKSYIVTMSRLERLQNIERRTEELKSKIKRSPEHHYHLRQLAKSQLEMNSAGGGGSRFGQLAGHEHAQVSLNFNYPPGHHHHQYDQQRQHQQHDLARPTIPIIVNEALESNGPEDEDDDDECNNTNSSFNNSVDSGDLGNNSSKTNNNNANGSRRVASPEGRRQSANSSLGSDVSLNVSDSTATGNSEQPMGPIAMRGSNMQQLVDDCCGAGDGLPADRSNSIFSNNMQTIREDSHDDSYMSSLCQAGSADDNNNLDMVTTTSGDVRASVGSAALDDRSNSGECCPPSRQSKSMSIGCIVTPNKSRAGAANYRVNIDAECDRDDEDIRETAVQLHEPLLAKSHSEPENLFVKKTNSGSSSNNNNKLRLWPTIRYGTNQDQYKQQAAPEAAADDSIELRNNKTESESKAMDDDVVVTREVATVVEVGDRKANEDNERGDRGEEQEHERQQEEDDEEKRPKSSLYLRPPKRQDMEEEDEKTLQHIETYIEKCICIGIICLKWFLFRQYVRKIVEHKYFDQCILILIIISSGTLALEDKHLNDRPTLKRTLDILDTIFTIIFSLEMIFKWLAFGMRRYFGNIWSWLDFVIVLVSFVNLMASIFGSGKIQALKTMRTLRAMRGLRPLRALQRFQGMRVVVNALIQAIPSIFNVLLVCLIFWLIFSIMGVQMFGGKFWRCLSPDSGELVSYDIAANKIECIEKNLTWSNPQINFDNVLNAYLALFQVATFKGWIDIMNSATDSRMRDDQPVREANIYMYLYFVFFVIFGSFFTLNLFIGVIIDNFNEQKKKTGGSLEIFMTDDQKKYYHAMKKMRSKKPTKAMTRPKFKPQAFMFDVTTSKKFDLAIMLIIGLNMFVMALEHYGQSQEFSNTLESLNLIFIAIFTLECLCKIFAMRHFYFREPWNIFDFIVVDLSILGVVMKEYVAKYFVSPTLLRVVRVVKVGRVLRLVKGAKGIRTLLFALAMSLPALFNICLLLFLVMFIYAIFGMSFFMNVRKRSGIDETFNFETFTSSIIVLFQMSTSAGWDLVLDPLMDEENDCQKPDPALGIEGTCGNKSIAIFYLISYVIVTFLIIINMYIAVILENYSQATEDVQEGLTDDDYEMYYEIWQKFDPNGTQYLPYEKLSDFVDALEDPLRIPKPNELALVVLDINIYQGNQCYCVDILDALTKFFFTRKGLDIQVNEHLQQVQQTLHETPFERITTTYLLKREHYCAKTIQNCWRRWKARTTLGSTVINNSGTDGGGSGGGTTKDELLPPAPP